MTEAEVSPRWLCEVCSKPLAGNDGVLFVTYSDINRREVELAAWEAEHPDPVRKSTDYDSHPERVHWHIRHDACGGDGEAESPYSIESGRIDSWQKVASWTAHLLDKPWFPETDWSGQLYRAGAGQA